MRNFEKLPLLNLLLLVITALSLRLFVAVLSPGTDDVRNFIRTARLAQQGLVVYKYHRDYPYPPPYAWILAGTVEITDRWNLPPQLAVRLPPLFADALISAIIFLAARACNPSVAPRLAWIYALNPITVMIASHHGQFDSLAYLPAILAIWLSLASPSILRPYGSALLIGIGGALKVTPAFLFPAWVPEFSRKNGLWAFALFALLAALPLTAAFLLGWHMAPHEFVQNVIGYRTHAEGGWGYNFATLILGHIARLLHLETLSSFLHSVRSLHQYILIACIILTSWLVREKVFIERVFLIQLSVQLFAGR